MVNRTQSAALAIAFVGVFALSSCKDSTSIPVTSSDPTTSTTAVVTTSMDDDTPTTTDEPTTTTDANVPSDNQGAEMRPADPGTTAPEYAPTAPPGATALCNDGKYSFSHHRSGTCSDNGGVAQWLTGG